MRSSTCGQKISMEQSLTTLMQRLCDPGPLRPDEADATFSAITGVLLQSHSVTERVLILAFSCVAALATRQAASTAVALKCGSAKVPSTRHIAEEANRATPIVQSQADAASQCSPSPQDGHCHAGPACASGSSSSLVLPFLPLLGAIAAGDEPGAEAALRRLNRNMARPWSALTASPPTTIMSAAARNTNSWRHGSSDVPVSNRAYEHNGGSDGGSNSISISSRVCISSVTGLTHSSLSSLLSIDRDINMNMNSSSVVGGGGGSGPNSAYRGSSRGGVSPSDSSAAATWWSAGSNCCSSLLAAREAEARLVQEAERCKAAAARLCGHSTHSEAWGGAAAAETAGEGSVRGACVAALAAAAADISCHRELLYGQALQALPILLRAPATAPHAAVLVHNLAAAPVACFRHQLRRRGVLQPLLEYLGRLIPPTSSPTHHHHHHHHHHHLDQPRVAPGRVERKAAGRVVDLNGLSVVLGAIAYLCSGPEGVEALKQPELGAVQRLIDLETWLGTLLASGGGTPVGQGRGNPPRGQVAITTTATTTANESGSGGGDGGSVDALCNVRRLLEALWSSLKGEVARPLEQVAEGCWAAEVDVLQEGTETAAGAAREGRACGAGVDGDGGEGEGGRVGEVGGGQYQGVSLATTSVHDGKDTSAASIAFQSQVLVDGKPLHLLTIITRTTRRRPDGTEAVEYQFHDQVSPSPDPGGPLQQSRPEKSAVPTRPGRYGETPAPPVAPICYKSTSSWLYEAAPLAHRNDGWGEPAGGGPVPPPPPPALASQWGPALPPLGSPDSSSDRGRGGGGGASRSTGNDGSALTTTTPTKRLFFGHYSDVVPASHPHSQHHSQHHSQPRFRSQPRSQPRSQTPSPQPQPRPQLACLAKQAGTYLSTITPPVRTKKCTSGALGE